MEKVIESIINERSKAGMWEVVLNTMWVELASEQSLDKYQTSDRLLEIQFSTLRG
jgi:hypothetical protein